MKVSHLPENERQRLAAIERYHILDTDDEKDFDDITELAAQLCNTPVSVITLVDEKRQWFKAKTGWTVKETARDLSFCAHTIHHDDVMIIPDTLKDERFFDNPLVVDEPAIRFYAGMPLITPDGYKLGTLAVIDKQPRSLSTEQLSGLRILAKQVVNLLNLRVNLLQLDNLVNRKINELNLIMSSALDAIVGMNAAGMITIWTPQAERIFGWKEEEVLGKPLAETIIPVYYREAHRKGLEHYLKTGEGRVINKLIEIVALNRAGKEFPVELTIAPIRQGENLFFCAFIRDITKRKRTEEDILKYNE